MMYIISVVVHNKDHLENPSDEVRLRFYSGLDVHCALRLTNYDNKTLVVYKDSTSEVHIPFGENKFVDGEIKCPGYNNKSFRTFLATKTNTDIAISLENQDLLVEIFSYAIDRPASNVPFLVIYGAKFSDIIAWQDGKGKKHTITPKMIYLAEHVIPSDKPREIKIHPQNITLFKNGKAISKMKLEIGGIYHILITANDVVLKSVIRKPYEVNAIWFFLALIIKIIGTYFVNTGYWMFFFSAPPYYLRAHIFTVLNFFYVVAEKVVPKITIYLSISNQLVCITAGLTVFLFMFPFMQKMINKTFS